MQIIGCDLRTRQQTLAIVDTETGELVQKVLVHEARGRAELPFHAAGAGARGDRSGRIAMQWFLNLMEELGIECQVGHPSATARRVEQTRQSAAAVPVV